MYNVHLIILCIPSHTVCLVILCVWRLIPTRYYRVVVDVFFTHILLSLIDFRVVCVFFYMLDDVLDAYFTSKA